MILSNHQCGWQGLCLNYLKKERTNLASDIHDGVLQDQIRLSRKFESYKARVQDEETKKILNEIEDELLDHIYTIRETCNNLRPPFLYELGLKQALINLFKQINLKATFSFIMIFLNELLHQVLNMNKQFIELCKSY